MSDRFVLLTFDVEEFDVPDELGHPTSLEEKIGVSREGTLAILDLLLELQVKATFFTTAQFAIAAPDVVHRITAEGHELASHSFYHDRFCDGDLTRSKLELERISGKEIAGFRMPRMQPVSLEELHAAGYQYDSSINPTFIPGRYNKLRNKRTIYRDKNLIVVPASVTPWIRFPLFWISLHVLPLWLFLLTCRRTLRHDGYVNLYLHPWEFVDLNGKGSLLPWYMTRNSGNLLVNRLRKVSEALLRDGGEFIRMADLVEKYRHKL